MRRNFEEETEKSTRKTHRVGQGISCSFQVLLTGIIKTKLSECHILVPTYSAIHCIIWDDDTTAIKALSIDTTAIR